MKKIFVCMYLAKNLGDDLFIDTLVRRYPNCKFILNHTQYLYDEFMLDYDNLDKCGVKRDYNKISMECDALIYMGGSLFQESKMSSLIYKNRVTIMEQFLKRNKPVFVLGSNFGPYKTQEFYNQYEELIKKLDDVCFRDNYSYELFKHLDTVRYAVDIAFNSDYFNNKVEANTESSEIGFSLIDLENRENLSEYHERYIESVCKSIKVMVDKGYRCTMMSFCNIEKDGNAIHEVLYRLPSEYKNKVTVYKYKGNIEESIELISKFKLFVSTRLHATIIGIGLGIPILPIVYNPKISNILHDIGLDEVIVSMDELDLLYDEDMIERAFDNRLIDRDKLNGDNHQFKKLDLFIDKIKGL